jgi:uncharacterized protein (TIGR02996 family)
MSTEEALLAAVRSAPDDDLPRLVSADWLEENGDTDRAEFIRLQIERAKMPPRTPPTAREEELYDGNRERWYGQFLRLLNRPPRWLSLRNNIRRGFVAELELPNRGNWSAGRLTPFLDSLHVALTALTLRSNDGDELTAPPPACCSPTRGWGVCTRSSSTRCAYRRG